MTAGARRGFLRHDGSYQRALHRTDGTTPNLRFDNPRYNARQLISRPSSEHLNSGRTFFGCEGNESGLGRIVAGIGEEKLLVLGLSPADRTEGTARFMAGREDLPASGKRKILAENAQRFCGLRWA